MALAAPLVALAVLLAAAALEPGFVLAAPIGHTTVTAKPEPPAAPTKKAPAKTGGEGGEGSASAPMSEGDVLAGNGLGSPLCESPGGLSPGAQRNCETSDFVAAPDPTGNYALDVNINTGVTDIGNDISTTIENFLQFAWMGLVALVHGLLVMFEWCYSLNLLSGKVMAQIARSLHETQLTFTKPWMIVVLSIASVLATYHGLVRRRVAETMGQVLMMLAMMLGGLWVIVNPAGTVGALENIANQASLGTLSAVTNGNPSNAKRNLAIHMQEVFGTVVSAPWCYMEFGNVNWCSNPHKLDGKLVSAGKKIAETEEEEAKCSGSCSGASPKSRQEAISAQLLRSAKTNGELFLALPANGEQRNSVKTEGTLLAELCEPEEPGENASADKCKGETAPEAEFRTEKGTGSRVMGLILIWLGALGMLLLFGFLVLRLLEAAIASLFYLLLAPAAVLAPALGDGGRSAFRGWGARLLAAVISKLIYSFLLGVVLMMMKVLLEAESLGWWAQWLLVSALWWVALHHRHKVLSFARGSQNNYETSSMRWFYRVRMAQDLGRATRWARQKLSPPPPDTSRPSGGRPRPGGGRGGPRPSGGGSGSGGSGPEGAGGSGGTHHGSSSKEGSQRPRPRPEREKAEPGEGDNQKPPDGPEEEDGNERRQAPEREQPEQPQRLVAVAEGRRPDDVKDHAQRDAKTEGGGKGEGQTPDEGAATSDRGRKTPRLQTLAEHLDPAASPAKTRRAPRARTARDPGPKSSRESARATAQPPSTARHSAPRPPAPDRGSADQRTGTPGAGAEAGEQVRPAASAQPRSARPRTTGGRPGRATHHSDWARAYAAHQADRESRTKGKETPQARRERQMDRGERQVTRPPAGKQ